MPKGKCPTCNAPAPKGMHCRACICDILGDQEFGTTKAFLREQRNAPRRKSTINLMSFVDFYAGA